MSTLKLLEKLKIFLPNNTAYKLLKSDLLYVENGAVLICRFELLDELFLKIHETEGFASDYLETFNELIENFIEIIYKHGGVFLKFDSGQVNILFDVNLIEKDLEETTLRAIECSFDLIKMFKNFALETSEKYDISSGMISFGLHSGRFTDLIIGNDKRKERILLGNIPYTANQLAYCAKNEEVLIPGDLYNTIRKIVTVVRKGKNYCVKSIKSELTPVELPHDDFLNLKNSIMKAFLPGNLFSKLKEDISEKFTDIKDATIIDLEFSGIHEYAEEFLQEAPNIEDSTEQKVFTDNFYFGLNKLFKKIFRTAKSFDGSINRVGVSRFGLRVLITFSLPKTFENDLTNREIFIEELNKISKSFKKFDYRIIHLRKRVFASIVGGEHRGDYIVTCPLMHHVNDVITGMEKNSALELTEESLKIVISKGKSYAERNDDCDDCNEEDSSAEYLKDFQLLNNHKLVGRNKEIIHLNQLLREGGKIISLSGEFGSGKTRLVDELIERMIKENFKVLHAKVENRDNIIDLFKYLIEEAAQISFFDNQKTIREKLEKYFELLINDVQGKEAEDFREKLFIIYKIMYNIDLENSIYDDLTPQLRLETLKEALSLYMIVNYRYFAKNSEGVIFVFDDIDNLKHEEKALMQYVLQYSISHLVEKGNRRNKKTEINKISFLVTQHNTDILEFNRFLKPVELELAPLKKDTMRQLLSEIVKGHKLPSEIEKVLLKRSQGNPFYLQQYFRFVLTTEMLLFNDGVYEKTKNYKRKNIPENIYQIVEANISRMQTEMLNFLQAASVIGVKFDREIVAKYFKEISDEEIQELLKTNYIKKYYRKNIFIFTHPIVSDVLYSSAAKSDKQKWHAKVAKILMDNQAETLVANPNWQGHHYDLAGNKKEAMKYHKIAFEEAYEKDFLEAAQLNLNKYLDYLEDCEEKSRLNIINVEILYKIKNYGEARKKSYKLLEKLESEKNPNYSYLNDLLNILLSYTVDHFPIHRIKEFLQKKSNYLKKLSKKFVEKEKGLLYNYYGRLKIREDKQKEALSYLRRSVEHSSKAGDYLNECHCKIMFGEIYEQQFHFQKSFESFDSALKLCHEHKLTKFHAIVLGNLGKIAYKLGKIKNSVEYYDQALLMCSELSLKEVEAKCAAEVGNINIETRELTKGLNHLEHSIKIYRALNNLEEISFRLSDFGECYIIQNNAIEAEKSFNKAHKIAREVNSSVARAYALQNLGRLKIMKKCYDEAEQVFKEAIKIFREKKLYKRIGMVYYYLAEMFYTQIVEYEDDPFIKYKQRTKEDISNILKYMKHSLEYSKRAKNIHFTAKGYLLLGKILNRKNRIKEALVNIQEGINSLRESDYSKMLVELYRVKADSNFLSEKEEEAFRILKETLKLANQNSDTSSAVALEKDITKKENELEKAS